MKVALVQFARDRVDRDTNLSRMCSMLSQLRDVDFVCLSEAWIGSLTLDEKDYARVLETLAEIAGNNGFNLLTGGLFNQRGPKSFDTCHIIDRSGSVVGFFDKRFPSMAFGERTRFSAGKDLPVFTVQSVKFGVMICVDAIYPELARAYALQGAQIVFNPSNIPHNRNALWKHITSTRAAENTVFCVYVNNTRTTYPDDRAVTGHSLVAGPDGEILLEGDDEERVLEYEIDLSEIDKVRARRQYLQDVHNFEGGVIRVGKPR